MRNEYDSIGVGIRITRIINGRKIVYPMVDKLTAERIDLIARLAHAKERGDTLAIKRLNRAIQRLSGNK
jgi:hypothetical protein